ncbi:AAA family ATPase [Sediminibacterium sp.]|uniref:ATP-dependent nuclease n=1 Tax=Sediminibacterium sp. TaxID=1917865 RepID=UPI0025EDFDBC|nr:AAA family ATPase [Sediminibacterium sp.]MBT9484335.1 AAA family ATPase [Sediminibacterium sp.]
MWLNQILTINYKSCNNINLTFSKDHPNILIGINDCGKSSILKAIGLLLSPRPVFNFPSDDKRKSDLSNSRIEIADFTTILTSLSLPQIPYDKKQTIIIGKLVLEQEDKEDDKLQLYSSHLQWIIDNLTADDIWLMRVFDESNQLIKDYILTQDVIENSQPIKLYSETAKNLKERAEKIKLSKQDIENENKTGRYKNVEYVNAIYKKNTLVSTWVDYSIKDEKSIFPEYNYLDWNVSMEQLQQVAKSAISTKINSFTDLAIRFAKRQSAKAQQVVDQELDNFTKQFAVDLPNIQAFKSNLIFSFESKLTDILINKNNTHGDIHLDSQGDGIKRQIWFALIKWSALTSLAAATKSKKFIWCFDEPETHLYPKAQRDFFQIIKQLSSKNIQTIISTHSTVFIDRSDFTKIAKFELDNGYSNFSHCTSTADIYEALQIRNSDFLFYDKFVIVEGDTEEILIPHLFKLHCGETLNAKGIQLINLGGKDKRKQNKQLLKDLLKDFNKDKENIIYLFDNDVTFELTATELSDLQYYSVGKQDIEDSIDDVVWEKIIVDKLSASGLTITIDEIISIKASIPDNAKINSNQKFYPKLKSFLKQKLSNPNDFYIIDDNLPDKGKNSGALLISYIDDLTKVDGNFILAFKKLLDE